MATKKKKPAARKRATPRRRPTKKRPAPAPVFAPSPPPVMEPGTQNGGLFLLVAIVALALGWLFWHSRLPKAQDAAPAVAAPAAAPEAAGAPPQARSIATAAPVAPTAKPHAPVSSAHREAAGATDAKPKPKAAAPAPAETGSPSLTYDRRSGETLSVRCWRSEGGSAVLEVFAPKNRRVRTLKSEAGKAGNVELNWDGKDEQGKKVPAGLYFLRPSQKDAQSIRDVWVEG